MKKSSAESPVSYQNPLPPKRLRDHDRPCNIQYFIEQTNGAASQAEVFSLYTSTLKKIGLDQVVYTFITNHPRIGQSATHGVESTYPEEWMKYYAEKNYYLIDPIPRFALKNSQPFGWDDIQMTIPLSKTQESFMAESKEAGLNSGMGIPLYGASGEIAGVGVASTDKKIAVTRNLLSQVNLLTQQFHVAYSSHCRTHAEPQKKILTPKETEILKWWAVGKTADEIAHITSSSQRAVKWHLSNIYAKLNANSKALAVVKAIRLGLIPLDALVSPLS